MKTVADTLSVARSNLAGKARRARQAPSSESLLPRGPSAKPEDIVLLPAIRALVSARQSYGYRRIPARTHEGVVIALRSNIRRRSDPLELTCRNGDIVRALFVIDACDREIIAHSAAAHAGISGEMVRNRMVEAVERRFGNTKAPHPAEWLSDNGRAYIARDTATTATALGLTLAFTPVRSPESNGIPEAFVKTLKRDYARCTILPDAQTTLRWIPE